MQFQNKTVIITGGSKGIGAACAAIFSREGANVAILDIEPVDDTAYTFFKCDVGSEEEVRYAISAVANKFGRIDVLVNNAGIQRYGSVTETTSLVWDEVMNINLKSAFLCAHHALPYMMKRGSGVVINVSSVQAFVSQPAVAAYTTAKTALLGLTRSIAVDYGPHIRCVAVCPGTVDTPMLREAIKESPDPAAVLHECEEMHLAKRIAAPEEIAETIVFLSSDKAAFITGQAFRVDGGLGIMIQGSKKS